MLGEEKNEAKYIETIPRRGYRFVASVTAIGAEPDDLIVAEHTRERIVIEQSETPGLITRANELELLDGADEVENMSDGAQGRNPRL